MYNEYRSSTIDEKASFKSLISSEIMASVQANSNQLKWWINFGKFSKLGLEFTDDSILQTHFQGIDLIGMFIKMNIFVLSVKNEKTLDTIYRTTVFDPKWDSLFVLYWVGKGYEIVFKSYESKSTKELQKSQFLFKAKYDPSDVIQMGVKNDDKQHLTSTDNPKKSKIKIKEEIIEANVDKNDDYKLISYINDAFEKNDNNAKNMKAVRFAKTEVFPRLLTNVLVSPEVFPL